jgi:uncharacterized protein (TIGR03437 family)
LFFDATVTTSDSLNNDWLAPDGTVVAGTGWGPVSGEYCFDNAPSLAISNLPTSQIGAWHARVWDNGTLLFSAPFTVSAPPAWQVTVLDEDTSTSPGLANNACTAPPLVTTFTPASPSVYLYFDVTGAVVGDSAMANFYAPDGALYTSAKWGPISSTGPSGYICFTDSIAISGALAASEPGVWSISVLWDSFTTPLFTLNFTIAAVSAPVISPGGVVNGASFSAGPVVPGSIVSIFGTALASGTAQAATNSPPTTLQSTQVLMNGIAAPLFYVSPTQINAEVPWEVSGLFVTDLTVQVISNGVQSNVVTTPLAATAPGIFAVVHNADNTLVTSAKPAVPGEYLVVYCTGLGTVSNQPPTGTAAPMSPLSYTAQNSTVTIGGLSASVPFSGLAPGFTGLYQVDAQVPASVASSSAAPLVLSIGGASITVAIAVQSGGLRQFTLTTTTAGSGVGSISANPPGPSYPAGTVVTLTATPNSGSTFAGWSGACSGTGNCTVTMNSNQSVTATFNLTVVSETLTITTSGTGSGTVSSSPPGTSCGSGCLTYATGTVVTLTATPSAGSTFAGWSGACSGTASCTVSMNSNQAVTAAFNLTSSGGNGVTISSLSSASPTPLTVLQIGTSGVNAANPVTLQFSNSSGFSVTEQAVSVQSDGTVTTGVPLYVDPSSGQIGPGTVSLVLTQGSQSSAPAAVSIQDLPPLSTYGTEPGQISHAFLTFEALMHARRLNELQSAQLLVGRAVDTSGAQATVTSLLQAAILAREDVDSLMSNASTVISWGTLPDGTPLQFDSTQLDVMDRLLAIYLTQQFGPFSVPASQSIVGARFLIGAPLRPDASVIQSVACFINVGCAEGEAEDAVTSPNPTEASGAFGTGLFSTLLEPFSEKFAGVVGMVSGLLHFQEAVGSEFQSIIPAALCNGSTTCTATQTQAIDNAVTSSGLNAVVGEVAAILHAPVVAGIAEMGTFVSASLEAVAHIANLESSGAVQNALKITQDLVSPSVSSQLAGRFGSVTGSVTAPTSSGTTSGQTGLNLCCLGAAQSEITALADSGGNYNVLVPTGIPDTNYGGLTMSATNPLTGASLGSEVVDLTSLTANAPVQVPPVGGGTQTTYPYTYTGTVSDIETTTQAPPGGCTPDPEVIQATASGSAQLTSNVPLENNGSFSGILTIGTTTGTGTSPPLTCTGADGTISNVPGTATPVSAPGSTLDLDGMSDGHVVTFSQDTQNEFCAGMTNCSISGTVLILATNVEITVNGAGTMTVPGSVVTLTLTFSLMKQ